MSEKNSYESITDDASNVLTVIVGIILAVILWFTLPTWFTAPIWRLICGVFTLFGWVCDGVGPYIPTLAAIWVILMVAALVWAAISQIRGK